MEIILFLLIAFTSVAWLIYWLIWQWRGKTRPIMAGSICLSLALAIALSPFIFFGVSYSEPGYGVILIVPTLGPLLLGIVAFVIGLFNGRRGASSNIKKVIKLVLQNPNR